MKKETIGLVVGIVVIVIIGFWVVYVPYYIISNVPEQELEKSLSEFSPMKWAVIFFPSCAAIMFILSYNRKKNRKVGKEST